MLVVFYFQRGGYIGVTSHMKYNCEMCLEYLGFCKVNKDVYRKHPGFHHRVNEIITK